MMFLASMSTLDPLIPPIYLVCSIFCFGTMLHTPGHHHQLRLTPFFVVLSFLALAGPDHFYFSPSLTSLWNLAICLYILHAISLFHIEKLLAPPPQPSLSSFEAWKWRCATAYRFWGNPRLIGLEAGTRACQPFLLPFAASRILKLLLYYSMLTHVVPAIQELFIGDIRPSDVSAEHRQLIRTLLRATFSSAGLTSAPQLASRALLIRAHTSIYWIWESLMFLDGANAILSVLFVCITRIDSVADWPPLFGSPAEATSVMTFWSRFWHQLATRPYVNIGSWLRLCCRVDRKSSVGKVLIAATVFALSGCSHAVVAWKLGMRDWHLELHWFMLNFCACTFEKASVALIHVTVSRLGARHLTQREKQCVRATVGRIWLFAFFCWSVPKWQYPRMERQAIAYEELAELRAFLPGF